MPRRASSTKSNHDELSESLVVLKAYIHALVVISRIIRWKPYNTDGHSSVSPMLLTLAVWSAVYYDHRLCLSTAVPLVVAYIATQSTEVRRKSPGNNCSKKRTDDNDKGEENQLRDVTTELAELGRLLPSSWPKLPLSPSMGLLLYISWQYVVYTSRVSQCVWLAGWICLMWYNPWVNKLRSLIAMSFYEYHHRQQRQKQHQHQQEQKQAPALAPTDGSGNSNKKSEIDRLYCFCIYEHQRWWIHAGWTSLMLPRDRPEWSDEYLEPTPSAETFGLPPPVGDQAWAWADPQWKVDEWEYADWDWEGWRPKRSIRSLTRRRRWVRCAHLEKRPASPFSASAAEDAAINTDSDSSYSSPPPSLLFSPTSRRSSSLLTHATLSSISAIVSHC